MSINCFCNWLALEKTKDKEIKTRPSALGMSDPVMESLEILGTPEFSNLWRVEGYEGENDEKVVKKDEKQWKIMKKW